MTPAYDTPIFGPYAETVCGETSKKYLMIPPEDIAAIEKLIADSAKLAVDQDARIKQLEKDLTRARSSIPNMERIIDGDF